MINLNELSAYLNLTIEDNFKQYQEAYYQLFFAILEPNLTYNKAFSEQSLQEVYASISPTRDLVKKGDRIIMRNEIIEGEKWDKLRSLKEQYTTENLTDNTTVGVLVGYCIIVIILLFILLFIYSSISHPNL